MTENIARLKISLNFNLPEPCISLEAALRADVVGSPEKACAAVRFDIFGSKLQKNFKLSCWE